MKLVSSMYLHICWLKKNSLNSLSKIKITTYMNNKTREKYGNFWRNPRRWVSRFCYCYVFSLKICFDKNSIRVPGVFPDFPSLFHSLDWWPKRRKGSPIPTILYLPIFDLKKVQFPFLNQFTLLIHSLDWWAKSRRESWPRTSKTGRVYVCSS